MSWIWKIKVRLKYFAMDQGESQVFPYDKPRIQTSPKFLNNDDDDDNTIFFNRKI